MTSKHDAQVLSGVPKCKKAVMCLAEELHVAEKLPSGSEFWFVGLEFNVNKSVIQYLKRKATLDSAKIISILCGEALEKMEK